MRQSWRFSTKRWLRFSTLSEPRQSPGWQPPLPKLAIRDHKADPN